MGPKLCRVNTTVAAAVELFFLKVILIDFFFTMIGFTHQRDIFHTFDILYLSVFIIYFFHISILT